MQDRNLFEKSNSENVMDYSIEYADQRSRHINNLIDNRRIHISSDDRQHRKYMENLADYILRGKTEQASSAHQYKVKIQTKQYAVRDKRVEYVANLSKREEMGDFLHHPEQKIREKRVSKSYKQADMNRVYFDQMFPDHSAEARQFRYECLQTIKETVEDLRISIGLHISDKQERQQFIDKKIQELEQRGKQLTTSLHSYFNGKWQFSLLKSMYNDLKGDYEWSKRTLSEELHFRKRCIHTTKYEINEHTYYYVHDHVVEVSKNRILLSDINTYRGLLMTYGDLKDKYKTAVDTDIWALLLVFEELVRLTKFTRTEKFVINAVFRNLSQRDIKEQYKSLGWGDLSKDSISRMINVVIPRKILATYVSRVEEWVFTEKLRGEYKACTQCGNVKLLNDRYFGRDRRNRDGYKSNCKVCDNLRTITRKVAKKDPQRGYCMEAIKLK